MSRTSLPAASWLWLWLWLWVWLWVWVWLARSPVWLQRETDSIMVMVIVSTCAAGVMPRSVLSCFVLSCLALHAPDRQQTNSSSTRLPATPGTHDVLCCVPLLFTWQLAGSASRSRPVVPKCDLASQGPMWESMLGARRTTKQGTAGVAALRPVRTAGRSGMPRGRRHSQGLLFPCERVRACRHVSRADTRTRCGLVGDGLCQNCVRASPRPAPSKLS